MEFETWWLLAIPLFFGLGWLAARLDARQAGRPTGQLPDAYFKGLNFLLNEQPDKAIDAFIDVVRLDPETVELHFALGNLFRRRGETERAIRVHQNLADRPDLDARQREHAVFELGQDFLRAGLLDRAEDAFNRLAGSSYADAALRHRLSIAQMVKDWPLAIDLAARLPGDATGSVQAEIAQFHCEIAAQALAGNGSDRFERAARELDAAQRSAPAHPRPALLRGELAMAEGDPGAAIRAWAPLFESHPAHVSLIARPWLSAHESMGTWREGLERLEQAHRRDPGVDTFAAIAEARARHENRADATRWADAQLGERPSLLGLDVVLGLRQNTEPSDPTLELMRRVITPQARRLSRFVCTHCGFKARQFYWQCPGCSRWDTYSPRRGEELEAGR